MALHHVGELSVSGGFDGDKFYVLDGGFATRLNKYSPESVSGPLWGSGAIHTDPEAVVRVHEDYLRAGANIITTNTYQCSPEAFAANLKLDEPGLDEYLLFEKAVQLADEAIKRVHDVPRYALVAGSVGPYGAVLCDGSEYSGNYVDSMSEQQLEKWHFERIKRLAVGKVDILAVETIPSLKEAIVILNVVERFPGLKCWVSFQCRDAESTAHGERFDDVVRQLLQHPCARLCKLVAIGVNCTDPAYLTPLLKLANRVNAQEAWPKLACFRPLPYVVYPNGGGLSVGTWQDATDGASFDDSLILDNVEEWMRLGANIIGGCCKLGPEHIAKIKAKMFDCLLDVMVYRMEKDKAEAEDNWDEIERMLKVREPRLLKGKKTPKSEKAKSVEKEGSDDETKEESRLPPLINVPGYMTPDQLEAHFQVAMNRLQRFFPGNPFEGLTAQDLFKKKIKLYDDDLQTEEK